MDIERVEQCVVKILVIPDDEGEEKVLGTGFFVDKNIVVTSGHVIDKYYTYGGCIKVIAGNNIETTAMPLDISDEGDLIVFLETKEQFDSISPLLFTRNYKINRTNEFISFGYPKVRENEGHIQDGIVQRIKSSKIINANIELKLDVDSKLPTYNGYSGSPFIINEMLVGVVQEQSIAGGQALSIGVSSMDMIKEYIPETYLIEDKYKKEIKDIITQYTQNQINRNKESKKYIPEIFVENGDLKEKCRFLTDPVLFYKKIIEDIERYKFRGLNRILRILGVDQFTININTSLKSNIELNNVSFKAEQVKQLLECKTVEQEGIISNLDPQKFSYNVKDHVYNIKSGISDKWIIEKWIQWLDMLIYKGVLITEHAGQGKTNFICDLTENVLIKKKIPSLYINAVELNLENVESSIERLVLLKLGYDFDTFIKMMSEICEYENKPFVIVIDGLNENSDISKFSRDLELFIECIKDYGFIRIIMTCRIELFEERFKNLEKYYNNYMKNINTLRIVNDIFNDRIYYGYLDHFDLNNLEIREFAYKKLVKNTLLLRIFCETNKGKTLPPINDIYNFDLFEEYWKVKLEQISSRYSLNKIIYQRLLDKILKFMIDNKQYSKIEIGKLNLIQEEIRLFEKLLDEDILFKKDEKIEQGFYKGSVDALSFVFDEFRDYALSKYLMIHPNDYGDNYVNVIKDITHKDKEVSEGISKYLFFESKRIRSYELDEILKAQEWYESVYINNIFSVNDEYIIQDDIDKVVNEIKKNTRLGWNIISNLLTRYDENIFKNLGITLLIDTIKNFNEQEYDTYIIPIAKAYVNKDDKLVVSSYDVNIDTAKHSLFKFMISILDTNYRYIDIYVEYSKKYLRESIDSLEYFLDSPNKIILNNVKRIIQDIKRNLDMNEVEKCIIERIESIESKLPKDESKKFNIQEWINEITSYEEESI